MAYQQKQLLQVNVAADRLWSTDKTGAYVASYNEGGWGAPNPVLSQSAVLFLVIRKGDTDTLLEAVGTRLFYDAAALNTYENKCESVYTRDGWHRSVIFQLDASLDGVTLAKDGLTIPNDSYFYYNGAIFHKVDGESTEVEEEDYLDLIDDEEIVQDFAENIFFSKLSVKYNTLYKEYVAARDCKNDDAEYLYRQVNDLRLNLESAYNLFWSGLCVEANDLIQSLYDKYGLE
jgi:hypothetical protein